jgi:hypothetical protein
MTLSRTARILIALLLVAAAAFVWINFFATTPDAPAPMAGPTVETPEPTDESAAVPASPPSEGEAGDASASGAADPATPADAAPTVVAPPVTEVVGRDVVVAELPFLVTEPPAPDDVAAEADGEAGAAADRPGVPLRASVNPFSPVVVQAAEAPVPTSPPVVDVEGSDAPAVETVVVAPPSAPAPTPLAPNSPRPEQLPRPLPRGSLPVAPDLLTSSRAEQAPRTPPNLPSLAAVREPNAAAEPPTLPSLTNAVPASTDSALDPLAPGAVPQAGVPDQPMVSGVDQLGRYLRDRNVAFTGSVVGSVGVGVFRVADHETPIVLALGQSLPDTDIVLTDLRGQAAEFTLGDTTHVLNLDLDLGR